MNPARPVAEAGLPSCLQQFPARINSEIHKFLQKNDLPGITEGAIYQLEGGGKRLRPALTLWFASACGCREQDAMPFGLAVELLHNVFLIQDDIQDGDTYRRGRPTLWRTHGVHRAINVADFLLAEAYGLIGETPRDESCVAALYRAFTTTFRCTVEGQALDLEERASPTFDVARYEGVVRRKTGRYLALTWVGAAIIAGHAEVACEPLWAVGDHLGPAFQIRDDLLDLRPAKGRGGVIGCDVREGKPSVLFALAMESDRLTGAEKERVIETLACPREETGDAAVHAVLEIYRRAGILEQAAEEARRRARLAIETFREVPFVNPDTAEQFRSIAAFVIEREV